MLLHNIMIYHYKKSSKVFPSQLQLTTSTGRQTLQKTFLNTSIALALSMPVATLAADSAEMAELKRMILEMKQQHEQKIQQLESRVQQAEARAAAAENATEEKVDAKPRGGLGAVTSGSAFNPQISVILDGNYYSDDVNGTGNEILAEADGISHVHGDDHGHGGHAHGSTKEGFNFRSAEIGFSASVDNYFDASALLTVDSSGSVDLEEAWLQTRSLPGGLKIKAGKFLSDIGYANNQHPHAWDFTDQNLAYLSLLGDHGLRDTGVQLTWLPDWQYYTLFGVEAFQGEQEKLGAIAEVSEDLEEKLEAVPAGIGGPLSEAVLNLNGENEGPRLMTAFVKFAPDLGYDHALQLGAWGAWADQHQEIHGEPLTALPPAAGKTPLHTLQGDAWMWGLDAVYKYDDQRAHGYGDFKLQAEYLWQRKDLTVQYHQANAAMIGQDREFTQDAFYLQGVYGIAPRWQAGLRYDITGMTSELRSAVNAGANTNWDESDRWTAAVTWAPTEYSRIRLNYSHADITREGVSNDFNAVYLQYMMSLGSHGAHKF